MSVCVVIVWVAVAAVFAARDQQSKEDEEKTRQELLVRVQRMTDRARRVADAEQITADDIPLLERCLTDLQAAGDDTYLAALFAARKIAEISYDEMLEMAGAGSKVLALRSVEFARNHNVPIHVRSSYTWEPGTWVTTDASEGAAMEDPIISGVVQDASESKVTVTAVPDRPGISAALFENLANHNINVDMIVQNASKEGLTDISFTVPKADMKTAEQIVDRLITAHCFGEARRIFRCKLGELALVVGLERRGEPLPEQVLAGPAGRVLVDAGARTVRDVDDADFRGHFDRR